MTAKTLQTIQDYIHIPIQNTYVRRSVDYHALEYGYRQKQRELLTRANLFQQYKTAKTYGKQTIPILRTAKHLKTMDASIQLIFAFNTKRTLTSVTITQRLNKIFGQVISVNALRTYI